MKVYAGIGSRKTPDWLLEIMVRIACKLAQDGWFLRSGGAKGADKAFQQGAVRGEGCVDVWRPEHANGAAYITAELYHPAWDRCSQAVKALHARNSHIILGADLHTPVEMVVCWTPGARMVGGTAQGLRIAEDYGIPIRNLADPEVLNKALKWIGDDRRVTLF